MMSYARHRRFSSIPAPPIFDAQDQAAVREFYSACGRTLSTPLVRMPALAAELGAGAVLIKDESARFGLPAFKTVGVRYAVARLRAERGGGLTDLAAATAGNHGRAVARAAREHGLAAHIYVPAGTDGARIAALEGEGAQVTVTTVGYDDTVRLMAAESEARGWTIVSDTAWDGYEQIPRWIMAGYTRILDEVAAAGVFANTEPRSAIVIVQAGVGSLAGAVAGWLAATFGDSRPSLVIVEPEGSACVLASLRAGERTALGTAAPTSMAGLRCAEVSSLAWPILRDVVDAAVTVTDAQVEEAQRRLAHPAAGDPAINGGASGAAGLAALFAIAHDPELAHVRAHLPQLTSARVLLINTEAS
jgi:diaminopropionate ammonia-lyase